MNLYGLVNICLVDSINNMIPPPPPPLMFQYGSDLEHFPRERNPYNEMENIVKLLEKSAKGDYGWEI